MSATFPTNGTAPDFIIIGAMKCGTSTLQAQLAAQPGIFMTTPKEPNFFSDDEIFARGVGWYSALFEGAHAGDLKGEASTHYTKLPTYPQTINRLAAAAPKAKLIYLMRHPIDRLVSHYIHEWTMGEATENIDDAVDSTSAFVAYSQYYRQLAPFIERYGKQRILPVFLERMNVAPDDELRRVAQFLGHTSEAAWRHDLGDRNVSRDRIKRFAFYDLLVESAPATALRRALAPKRLRDWVKARLQMRTRPSLSAAKQEALTEIFDQDLQQLGALLGAELSCANFKQTVCAKALGWSARD
jgi:Sulfotransferase domain